MTSQPGQDEQAYHFVLRLPYGRSAGDEVLKCVTIALSANLRGGDKIGRHGGEEFLFILPGSTVEDSVTVVDRLRQIVAALDWAAISSDLRVTMSVGVAQVRPDDAPDDALSRADIALYKAKKCTS